MAKGAQQRISALAAQRMETSQARGGQITEDRQHEQHPTGKTGPQGWSTVKVQMSPPPLQK